MSEPISTRLGGIGRRYVLPLTAMAAVAASPVAAQEKIDPAADRILTAMGDTLKSMQVLKVDYEADQEVLERNGQKIQYSASGSIALDRAKGLSLTRMGPFAQTLVTFDGKTISLYDKASNVYEQLESPGSSLDEAVAELRAVTDVDAPGADLLASDPHAALSDGVIEGTVVGTAFVNGIQCDHLAFRNDEVDWQIWITRDAKPLPLKYVITTKWVTGAPQYTLRLNNWNSDRIDDVQFKFTPPADARKLDNVHADVTGEFAPGTEQ